MYNKNWQEDHNIFINETVHKLSKYGYDIGEKAEDGNEVCIKIMEYYKALYRSFDPITHYLIQEEIKKYEETLK